MMRAIASAVVNRFQIQSSSQAKPCAAQTILHGRNSRILISRNRFAQLAAKNAPRLSPNHIAVTATRTAASSMRVSSVAKF